MQTLNFSEKSEEYIHGYGYCQCGCGEVTQELSNGMHLKFIVSHRKKLWKIKEKEYLKLLIMKNKKETEMMLKENLDTYAGKHNIVNWSRKYRRCIKCATTKIPHLARGYCRKCYEYYITKPKNNYLNKKDKIEYALFIRRAKKNVIGLFATKGILSKKISRQLRRKVLIFLYYKRHLSIVDLSLIFECSRNHIFRLLCIKKIMIKSKAEAKQDMFLIRKKFRFNRTLIEKEK